MADARPELAIPYEVFGLPATVQLPGPFEFNLEPESAPITVTLHVPAPSTVPLQLDAATYEAWDWVFRVRRAEAPSLRNGAILRCPDVAGGPIKRWFVGFIEKLSGDELRGLIKEQPEEA